jgi:hypothetical protein
VRGSNTRPSACEADVLTTVLTEPKFYCVRKGIKSVSCEFFFTFSQLFLHWFFLLDFAGYSFHSSCLRGLYKLLLQCVARIVSSLIQLDLINSVERFDNVEAFFNLHTLLPISSFLTVTK